MEPGLIIAIGIGAVVGGCIIAAGWLAGQYSNSACSSMDFGQASDAEIAAMATTVCLLASV